MTYCMPLALGVAPARPGAGPPCAAVAESAHSMYYAVFFNHLDSCALFACLCLMTRPPLRRMIGLAAMAGVVAVALAVPLARVYSKAQLGRSALSTR